MSTQGQGSEKEGARAACSAGCVPRRNGLRRCCWAADVVGGRRGVLEQSTKSTRPAGVFVVVAISCTQ